MPLIPILIGVIILGLAFGAGLSVLTQRESNAPSAVVTAAPTPGMTPLPQASPAPTPRRHVGKGSTATLMPPTKPIALALPTFDRDDREKGVAVYASSSAQPRSSPSPLVPRAVEVVTPVPSPTVPSYAVVATAEPRAAATDEADSDFARASAAVVRAYFAALARGDDADARAALDPSKPHDLGEKEFVDSSLRITSLDAHGTGNTATVNVDLVTTRGDYFEQFFLRRSPTGTAVIIEHTYIKP
jgi:hypothetical protein